MILEIKDTEKKNNQINKYIKTLEKIKYKYVNKSYQGAKAAMQRLNKKNP